MIDLQIAAVQVDILDGEPGTFPRPQAGMQQDDKQIAVAASVGVGIHKIQKGGLLLRRESRKEKGFQPAVPSSTAFLNTEDRNEWSLRSES